MDMIIPTNLVYVLFDPAIPTSSFNFIQLIIYLYTLGIRDGAYEIIYEMKISRYTVPSVYEAKFSVDSYHSVLTECSS